MMLMYSLMPVILAKTDVIVPEMPVGSVTAAPFIPIPIVLVFCVLLCLMKRKGIWNFARQIMIAVLIFLINLRIGIPTASVDTYSNNVKILFVVDNTISMQAEDYQGDGIRMNAVQDHIGRIMDEFEGARYAVMAFNDISGNVQVPYTTDKKTVTQAIGALEGRSKIYASGSSFNVILTPLRDYLEGTYSKDEDDEEEKKPADDAIQLLFFFSDGEMNTDEKLKSFDVIAESIDGGAVFGYGTTAGGQMRVREYSSSEEKVVLTYIDKTGHQVTAKSKIDESTLKKLAEDMNISYKHILKDSDILDITEGIKSRIDSGEMTATTVEGYGRYEITFVFAGILFALVIYDLVYYGRKMGRGQ